MSVDGSQTKAPDKIFADAATSDSILATAEVEMLSTNGDDKHVEWGQLCLKVEDLILRVTNLEQKCTERSVEFPRRNTWGLGETPELETDTQGSAKSALAVVNHNLITSKPRNENIFGTIRNVIVVLKRYNFALLQCLIMLVTLGGLIIFGALKFCEAHQSVNDPYKPYKVDGRDEYYRNKDLKYELPLHYFWFELAVSESNFFDIYNHRFNETCDGMLKACLGRYMGDFINPSYELSPTDQPTSGPSSSPTNYPTQTPVDSPQVENTNALGITQIYTVSDFYEPVEIDIIYNAPVSAECFMTTASNETVMTETIGLRNLTLHVDEIGVDLQNNSDVTDIFGMLMRLEFDDFTGHVSGKIMCDLYLDIERLEMGLSGFASYDILFMVSREEFSSGTTGITEYGRSMKKVWRRQNELIDQIYSYVFEENTFDGISDFTAEVHLVDEDVDKDAMLNIEVYPYPTVIHYISFDRYSYLDWIADVGGFYTIAICFSFFSSKQLTKFANRRDLFQKKQGILPAFSLPHRNAEEIAGLRSLVMAGLGITDEEYFKLNVQSESTLRKTLRKSAFRID